MEAVQYVGVPFMVLVVALGSIKLMLTNQFYRRHLNEF